MKNSIIVTLFCSLSVCCYAQQWYVNEQPSDDLKGTKSIYNMTYKMPWGEYFNCIEGNWNSFSVHTWNYIDTQYELNPFWTGDYSKCCFVKIGLYNADSKMVKKYEDVKLSISDKDYRLAHLRNSEIAKAVLQHLFKTNGFVRILIPAAASEDDIELKIPHFSNPKKG